ncbi:hypothetical protein JTE90_006320 [Oedothorax gibbosus]|uniref:Uncharacterized protein n=1 Tax=Oedothorax gibbosus TaxID=931172 RepID=A0AAV6U154_9ARAC|nr:hypothetical protein JTE90_006320 [Oedothorax gibbosus]
MAMAAEAKRCRSAPSTTSEAAAKGPDKKAQQKGRTPPSHTPANYVRAHKRSPLTKFKAAKDEFAFMLEHGICRPSKSPWAIPLHMAPKNNSDWRPTVDYRILNSKTRPDKYPLPNLQDFTQFDLVRAVNQIPVFAPDIEKTAADFQNLNLGGTTTAHRLKNAPRLSKLGVFSVAVLLRQILLNLRRLGPRPVGYDAKAKGHLGSNTSILSVVT